MARPVVGRRRRFRLRPVSDESHGVCGRRGTRLRPLTDTRPKALVEVAGQTLLEHVVRRLVEAGVTESSSICIISGSRSAVPRAAPPFRLRRVAFSTNPSCSARARPEAGGLVFRRREPSWFTMWMC